MPPTLSHNDDATLIDAFDNQPFVREVCQVIRDCSPPKGIAINGYWGTGKTSALARVYYHLTGECPFDEEFSSAPPTLDDQCQEITILPLWFEAWRYQNDPQPVVALLNEIRTKMGLWEKFMQKGGKLAGVSFLGILSAFDEVAKAASGGLVKPDLGKLKNIGNAWEQERYQQPLPSQALRSLLEEAVDAALKRINKKKTKLVVFIDDLDRCEPAVALRLLEGIKVYLNLRNCVVVFGMDQRQIERALGEALQVNGSENNNNHLWPGPEHQAREYLEKICQDIYHLPLPSKDKKSAFLNRLLVELNFGNGADMVARIVEITDVYDCLPANPRKIKMLANRLSLMLRRLMHGNVDGSSFTSREGNSLSRQAAIMFAVSIVYCFHRSVYEELVRNPSYISTLFEYATTSSPDMDKFRPMHGIIPSRNTQEELPVNPSDSNVFRLHQLLADLDEPLVGEINPFLSQ